MVEIKTDVWYGRVKASEERQRSLYESRGPFQVYSRLYKGRFYLSYVILTISMARTKADKQEIIEKMKQIGSESESLVFVNFHGLKVSGATEVRRKLKSENVNFFVAKKSIMRKAFENIPGKTIAGSMPELEGEVGVAYGKDLIAPAREVLAFQNKFKGNVTILGGIFEGKYMTKDEMLSIALIPSLLTLRGMFANVINSPVQGFVMALDQIAKKKTA